MIGASDDEEVGRRAAAVTDRDERERKRGGKGGPPGGAGGGGSMGSAGHSGFFDCLTRLLAAKFSPFSLRRGRPYR